MNNYFFIGIIVTLASIFYYRKDGTTKAKFELYFATIGPLIWPFLILKFIFELLKKLWQKEKKH